MAISDLNGKIHRLVLPAKQGDYQSLCELWGTVRGFLIRRFADSLRRARLYDGDIEGFCYLAFHEALQRYDPDRGFPFLTYCFYILKYHTIAYMRERHRVRDLEIPFRNFSDEEGESCDELLMRDMVSPSFDDDVITRVWASGIREPDCRIALMLMEGYTVTEVMYELKISKSTFYRARNRIRRALKEVMP
ncbi:MAG: hypothetical protein KatS3mg023_3746 [Armatimonadota bacterium]|nr:MAG: hypothetical protein KatS3mg023_3746 [Armatimonadota bacterium]